MIEDGGRCTGRLGLEVVCFLIVVLKFSVACKLSDVTNSQNRQIVAYTCKAVQSCSALTLIFIYVNVPRKIDPHLFDSVRDGVSFRRTLWTSLDSCLQNDHGEAHLNCTGQEQLMTEQTNLFNFVQFL